MDTVELLRGLSEQFGVSGFEDEIRDWIYGQVKDKADDIRVDVLGNLMTTIHPGKDLTVMLDAHMDEIGIMVSYVEEGGFLRFAPIGGWDPRVFPAQQVEVRSKDGRRHRGVIGASPPWSPLPFCENLLVRSRAPRSARKKDASSTCRTPG